MPPSAEPSLAVPLRRQWTSVWIGTLAVMLSGGLAVVCVALLGVVLPRLDGAVLILLAGVLWGVGFFGSMPGQRRSARAVQQRAGPHLVLTETGLRLPGGTVPPLAHVRLLQAGWVDETVHSGAHAARWRELYAVLADDHAMVLLWADDAVPNAACWGWPRRPPPDQVLRLRLWSADVVRVVEWVQGMVSREEQG
ncbi:MAG TPA: hypothetical protein VGE07_11365 [Herpetosiphonaceae bacterium]